MDEKKKLIKDLSVALPIYYCCKEILEEREIWQKLLDKTYHKRTYKLPAITIQVHMFFVLIKWGIAFQISMALMFFVVSILSFVFPDVLIDSLAGPIVLLTFALSIVLVILGKERQRDKYRKEIEKANEELREFLDEYDCQEMRCLPEKYWYYDEMDYIYECLVLGRANTVNEALRLCDQKFNL